MTDPAQCCEAAWSRPVCRDSIVGADRRYRCRANHRKGSTRRLCGDVPVRHTQLAKCNSVTDTVGTHILHTGQTFFHLISQSSTSVL